jgi:hypothetical protein
MAVIFGLSVLAILFVLIVLSVTGSNDTLSPMEIDEIINGDK